MVLFWITQAPFADLSGKGGLYASARWHTRGRPIVYTASSRALAILERLVHTDPEDIPSNLVLLTVEVPGELSMEQVGSVPIETHGELLPAWCAAAGDAWLARGETVLLRVPSALVPEEPNFLMNPLHPDSSHLRVSETRSFAFDPRLLSSR